MKRSIRSGFFLMMSPSTIMAGFGKARFMSVMLAISLKPSFSIKKSVGGETMTASMARSVNARAIEHARTRRGPTHRVHVDVSSDGPLGELGAVGNENDLVIQPFFGKETGVVSDPNADVSAAD